MLVVEPDRALRLRFDEAVPPIVAVDHESDFVDARRRMQLPTPSYDWLVTNLRLGAYNGLHLVHLASAARKPIRMIVYSDRRDLWLAREAQQAGAFFEYVDCVHLAVSAYLRGTLPASDRRNPASADRRTIFRGGRRCVDSMREGVR